MAAYNKFNIFVEDVNEGVHNMASNQLEVALTATANAPVATNSVLTDLTPITYTDLSARTITLNTSGQNPAGTYELSLVDLTINCTGAGANAFQYVAVFNQGTAVKTDPLICWFNYGSSLQLNNGESLTIDFGSDGGPNGVLYTMT
jgi:hypothetical protein